MSSYLFVIMLFSSGSSFSIETADKESCNAVMAIIDKFLSEKSISARTECREEFNI